MPQAVFQIASANYDQAFATGMGQMFPGFCRMMFLAAGTILLGMSLWFCAPPQPRAPWI